MASHFLFANNTTNLHDLWYESHASVLKMVAMELGAADQIPELLTKYLGQKVKMKAPKDPNKPKRPKTAFMHFCDKHRPALIEKARKKGKVNIGTIAKTLGAQWGKLNTKQRKPFANAAEKSKSTYEKDMSEYNENEHL